jgi:hypothetical protein
MSFINEFASICPEDCTTGVVFPAATVEQDCLSYDTFYSQIGDFVIVPDGAPDPFENFAEGATLTLTAGAIDNAGTDNTTGRRLRGKGSLGEGENQTVEGPYRQTKIVSVTAPFEFIVDNVSEENRAIARALQCNPTNFKAYLGTADHTFGKAGGMAMSNVRAVLPLGAGRDDVQQIIIRADITWRGASPERAANNPFA